MLYSSSSTTTRERERPPTSALRRDVLQLQSMDAMQLYAGQGSWRLCALLGGITRTCLACACAVLERNQISQTLGTVGLPLPFRLGNNKQSVWCVCVCVL